MNKIIKYDDLVHEISKLNGKTVLVTGVFDLLHQGHINFLKNAKNRGDYLLVGLESDERVSQLKGKDRPIENIKIRLNKIASLRYVDFAFALPINFDSIERERFISIVRPAVFAVSSHTLHQQAKRSMVEKYGGVLEVVMEKDENYSTTALLKKKQSKDKSAK